MHLEFHGAARGVTGSRHLLSVDGKTILLDCGLFQGRRSEAEAHNRDFGFSPKSVDAVVVSHAHIDHSGALPSLVRRGFKGNVHATLATADLMSVMLEDSAEIQERDVEYLNKRRRRKKEPPKEPLYTVKDAHRTMHLVEGHRYHRPVPVLPGVAVTFYDAGHILGSAVVQLDLEESGRKRRLVFSGDLGRPNVPILRDPESPESADALIIESTYGDRVHGPVQDVEDRLAGLINRVFAGQGKLIIPAFAVGRTQELVYTISRLMRGGRIPGCRVYVDSPLAIDVTEVFARHPETYDEEICQILRETGDPFGFELLQYTRTTEESKRLNTLKGPFIVISASGMVEAGRILHHVKNGVEDPRNVILFVGYQAQHTLGRRMLDGVPEVKVFGDEYDLRAEVVAMNEFSAHADRNELLAWVNGFKRKPERVFVVHGEESQSFAFADALRNEAEIPEVSVPKLRERQPL
jgi:metallo-beta-lactamase family protein